MPLVNNVLEGAGIRRRWLIIKYMMHNFKRIVILLSKTSGRDKVSSHTKYLDLSYTLIFWQIFSRIIQRTQTGWTICKM